MVTSVGNQEKFCDALIELVELDYDAVEAYEAAINRLENAEYRNMLEKFKQDHQRHITELSGILKSHGEDVPEGPSAKQWLTKGKVVIANLVGDKGILTAMQTNEVDTNTAYEKMDDRQDKWEDVILFLKRGLEDEKRHKAWIDSQLT